MYKKLPNKISLKSTSSIFKEPMMRHLNFSPDFDMKLYVTLRPDKAMSGQIFTLPACFGEHQHTELFKLLSQ